LNILFIILISGLAGILGTGVGALIGIYLGKKTDHTVSLSLIFSSGMMVGIAVFDLIPEANELGGAMVTATGVLLGVVSITFFNYLLERKTNHSHILSDSHECEETDPHLHLVHNNKNEGLLKSGFFLLFAVAIHNISAGMAIGASGTIDTSLAIMVAVLLTLHNIPEGMAMAMPLVAGGIKRFKTLLLIVLASATTMVGALIGVWIGGISPIITGASLAFAAGAMLYIIFDEIVPKSILMRKGEIPTMIPIAGIVAGFIITSLF
jgi:ZIP family zinc transporter